MDLNHLMNAINDGVNIRFTSLNILRKQGCIEILVTFVPSIQTKLPCVHPKLEL